MTKKKTLILKIIISSIFTLVATSFGLFYAHQQNKITEQNNYFTTINNIKEKENSIELLLFAFADNPSRYKNILKYMIIKNDNKIDKDIINILQDNAKIEFLKVQIEIIKHELKKINSLQKNLDENSNKTNNILNHSFKWIKNNLYHYLYITKNEEILPLFKEIETLAFSHFDNIMEPERYSYTNNQYKIKTINIQGLKYSYINTNVKYLIDIISILDISGLSSFEIKTNNHKVLKNLTISTKISLTNNANFQDIKEKFNFIPITEVKEYPTAIYNLISFLYIMKLYDSNNPDKDIENYFNTINKTYLGEKSNEQIEQEILTEKKSKTYLVFFNKANTYHLSYHLKMIKNKEVNYRVSRVKPFTKIAFKENSFNTDMNCSIGKINFNLNDVLALLDIISFYPNLSYEKRNIYFNNKFLNGISQYKKINCNNLNSGDSILN